MEASFICVKVTCFVLFFSQEENARRWRVLLILYISTQVFLRTREN